MPPAGEEQSNPLEGYSGVKPIPNFSVGQSRTKLIRDWSASKQLIRPNANYRQVPF